MWRQVEVPSNNQSQIFEIAAGAAGPHQLPPGEYFYFIHVKHLKCMVEQHIATYISHADMVKNTSKYLYAYFRLKHTAHSETDSGSGLADTGKSQ